LGVIVVRVDSRLKEKPYKLSLSSLHALCESNYLKFLRVFRDYQNSNERVLMVGDSRIVLTVTERARYTTTFKAVQVSTSPLIKHLELELRAYHDARMLEVLAFQRSRFIKGTYRYPNSSMHQKNEKLSQTQFVSEWLSYLLAVAQAPTRDVHNDLQWLQGGALD
jgi:uncharacterized protein YqiB (DUF1249 family)